MGLFDFFKKKPAQQSAEVETDKQVKIKGEGEKIVAQLEQLGYFKYAHSSHIPELKKEIAWGLNKHQHLFSVDEEEAPYNSKDFRHFHLDGEDLFEQGGFLDKLAEMQILFEKIDFSITITNHIEDYETDSEGLNHSMTINGKDYIIFKDFKGYGWGEAAQKFADILNDQLKIHGKDERIYLANGANDGRAVFMTEEQYKFLDPLLDSKDKSDRPLEVEEWCKVMKVVPV